MTEADLLGADHLFGVESVHHQHGSLLVPIQTDLFPHPGKNERENDEEEHRERLRGTL